MKEGSLRLFVIGVAAMGLLAAGCELSADKPPPALPDEAWGYASDPLPQGATLVTKEAFDSGVASGIYLPVTRKSAAEQEAVAAAAEAEDDKTIAAAVKENPALASLVPSAPKPDDATVSALPDGNYLHTIRFADGTKDDVVTMGPRWQKRALADALRTFPTRDNQVGIYRTFFAGLPAEWRKKIELPDPEKVAADPKTYDVTDVKHLNDRVVAAADGIIGSLTHDPKAPPGYVSDCTKEEGAIPDAGRGGDRGRSKYDGSCAFQAGGIYKNYDFPSKYYTTCVKDQWVRGTCSIFANTSAVETWVARKFGRWVNLSEQAFYNRAKLTWERRDYGDGICEDFAFRKMREDAWLLPFESQWPYNPSPDRTEDKAKEEYASSCTGYADTCSDTTHQSALVCVDVLFYRVCAFYVPEKNPGFQGYRINDSVQFWDASAKDASLLAIKLCLAMGWTVGIGHPITAAWDDAEATGYLDYKANDTNRGGHGIHAVGFIDNDDLAALVPSAPEGKGGGYLIVKNSWSNCWGDGGYIYVPYQSVKDYTPDATVLYGIQ
jgi:hypothetical protein